MLSGIATHRIREAFRKTIEKEDLLLCADGRLDSKGQTARIPSAAIDTWGVEDARKLFSPNRRSVLAAEVRDVAKLETWKLLEPSNFESMLTSFAATTHPVPRPDRLEALAAFWSFAQRTLPYAYDWWHKAKVVPVESRTYLGRANETLATRTCPSGCGPEDWHFILERADILDSNWESLMELIRVKPAEALQKLEAVLGRHFTQKDVAGILDGFRLTELNQVPTVERVFAQVAPRLFDEDSLDRASAIRFVQIAAKLNVNYPKSVPVWFLCVDDKWRAREDGCWRAAASICQHSFPKTGSGST